MKQLNAKILSNEKVGTAFYKMRLASSYLAKLAKPGQFVEIRCSKGTAPLLRRPLGVHRVSSLGIEVLYEVVGKGTEIISNKRAGEDLDIIGPLGNGFDLELGSDVNILVAGGIGVAPLMALAEGLSVKKSRKIHVLIGARVKSHVMCEGEFKALGCAVKVTTDDGSRGYKGLVTELLKKLLATHKVKTYLPDFRGITVYACGPNAMLKSVAAIAMEHGIPCQASFEERMACGVGVCLGCPVKVKSPEGYKMVCKDGPVFDAGEILW